jgi:phenylpyruvate tautomerase PptA (4-oxalocrotonate tautomerase family)
MPQINCQLLTGYDKKTKKLLAERITDATCSAIGTNPALITVAISEILPENYMRDRSQKQPSKSPPLADKIISKYLKAMEERDIQLAKSFLNSEFLIKCPGGLIFYSLEDFIEWAKTRYKSIMKDIETIDLSFNGAETFVYCHGTLKGEWLDGSSFVNVRFIDKFHIRESRIVQQEIWNDLNIEKNLK